MKIVLETSKKKSNNLRELIHSYGYIVRLICLEIDNSTDRIIITEASLDLINIICQWYEKIRNNNPDISIIILECENIKLNIDLNQTSCEDTMKQLEKIKWTTFEDTLENLYRKEDGSLEVYKKEDKLIKKVFMQISKEFHQQNTYEIIKPIGRGGAGIVVKVKDKRLNLDRALKIPRPRDERLDSVKNEINYLNKLRHDNIISIYTLGEVNVDGYQFPYPYFVMDYIKGTQDLKEKTKEKLSTCSKDNLKDITKWLSEVFYKIAKAIEYLHSQDIIHFDIKPTNILIGHNNKPILSDLGFAKKKTEDKTEVVVGCTDFYAHPNLKNSYYKMSSKNFVRQKMSPINFEYIFDIYAFGKSILEMLSIIGSKLPDIVVLDYNFRYLHLSACRMLDGRNMTETETSNILEEQRRTGDISVYKEEWFELDAINLKEIRYKSFKEICEDFEKLLNIDNYYEEIPELDPSFPKRIQCCQNRSTPFSGRVKAIVEHPVFSRLSDVSHLGLLSSVFPTATHNRLEHSLGTFHNTILYVTSLFNDPYNPLFKQLATKTDIKSILLASLLHDIGQYPLAHEIEEVDKNFKHEEITLEFLDNSIKDKSNYTLKEIIKEKWGIDIDALKNIWQEDKKDLFYDKGLKNKMLSSIIDGPIDVDKLDYLLRDSQDCHLKYGELIDIERLIRNLTVVISDDTVTQEANFKIGCYEKGKSAAESFAFARYLLYQSLYWHHTSRAIRVMLREALIPALKVNKEKKRKSSFYAAFKNLLQKSISVSTSISDILDLIYEWTDDKGKELIKMIKERNYYKRILTIHDEEAAEKGKATLLMKFRNTYKKEGFQETLQTEIKQAFLQYTDSISPDAKVSSMAPKYIDNTIKMLSDSKNIICDCPIPNYGSDRSLEIIPEPKRQLKQYLTKKSSGQRVSELWNEVYYKLMNMAAKGRIFCHPDIRDTLMSSIGPEVIKNCLTATINSYK